MQLVVPKKCRPEIQAALHEGGYKCGHLGQEKTFHRFREPFYWPRYWSNVRHWCETCACCATKKSSTRPRRVPPGTIAASCPTEVMAMDILGPFRESKAGNIYILVVADYLTRWMEAFTIPYQETSTIANKLVDEIFMHFGIPTQLHSDQGWQFKSHLMQTIRNTEKPNNT